MQAQINHSMAYILQGHLLPRPVGGSRHMHVPHSTGNGSSNGSAAHAWQPPYKRSEPQEPSAELMDRIREAGVDSWQDTGLQYLSDDARVRRSTCGSRPCSSSHGSPETSC